MGFFNKKLDMARTSKIAKRLAISSVGVGSLVAGGTTTGLLGGAIAEGIYGDYHNDGYLTRERATMAGVIAGGLIGGIPSRSYSINLMTKILK